LASGKTQTLAHGKLIWDQVQQYGIELDQPQYGAALYLCAKAGDADWARDIWSELRHRKMEPSDPTRNHYLNALAQHGGTRGWETVYSELSAMKQSGWAFGAPSLAVLLNAAGSQHDLARTEHVWQELAPVISHPSCAMYGAKAKALLLCNAASRVPPLRADMQSKGILPDFRLYKNEAQAHLLLLQESPSSEVHLHNLHAAVELARRQAGAQPLSRNERSELEQMHELGQRLAAGESLRLSEVRVERWPWPQ